MTYHNCIRSIALGFAASLLSVSLEAFAIETYYDGFTAFSAPTCSSASGGTIDFKGSQFEKEIILWGVR
jgi:hypothetical protein